MPPRRRGDEAAGPAEWMVVGSTKMGYNRKARVLTAITVETNNLPELKSMSKSMTT
eukprot:SAG31_NODE_23017_length_513_cov_0.874396_1_plen_56_part_00